MKHTIHKIIATLVCAMVMILPVHANATTDVTFTQNENKVNAELVILKQATQTIQTLQLDFQIEVLQGTLRENAISFQFSPAIKSKIKEYRYKEGTLTIYIAGDENLYETETLDLGAVVIDPTSDAKVKVSVDAEEGLKTVDESNQMEIIKDISATPVEVVVGSPNGGNQGETDPVLPPNGGNQEEQVPPLDKEENLPQEENPVVYPPGVHESEDVDTSDSSNPLLYGTMLTGAILVLAILYVGKKKQALKKSVK